MQAYSNPERESDPHALPDVEVFHIGLGEESQYDVALVGWYYWYCFPGCMPDSDPMGPYDTAQEAKEAAQEEAAD